ncbi:MAG: hypothetical protein ACR2KL_02800 [Nocardioidaceae bacterium]
MRQVVDRHGRVDVLVNNASRGGVRVAPADRHRAAARGPGSRAPRRLLKKVAWGGVSRGARGAAD